VPTRSQGVVKAALAAVENTDGMGDGDSLEAAATEVAAEKSAAAAELRLLSGTWAELEMDLLNYGVSGDGPSGPAGAAAAAGNGDQGDGREDAFAAAAAGQAALEAYQACAVSGYRASSGRDPDLAVAALCDKLLTQWEDAARRRGKGAAAAGGGGGSTGVKKAKGAPPGVVSSSSSSSSSKGSDGGGPFLFDPSAGATEVASLVIRHTLAALRFGHAAADAMAAIPRCVPPQRPQGALRLVVRKEPM
jgi:hypothetical protein